MFGVTFASMGLEVRQPYLAELQNRGIECLYRPCTTSGAEHLREQGRRYDLVILSRLDTAAELLPIALRWCPHAKIIFDTVDLHFQHVAREAAVRRDPRIRTLAGETGRYHCLRNRLAWLNRSGSYRKQSLTKSKLAPGSDRLMLRLFSRPIQAATVALIPPLSLPRHYPGSPRLIRSRSPRFVTSTPQTVATGLPAMLTSL